ncbi:ribosomal protein S18-alanine N-acetyltransferase [uncultured Clostridium sp.]|uniref:ribosomal protein S18-alanine N-acetyltransferase n=1 Tax=uncultured Clostridium sp. TaxID=59620 RepID=UPI0025FD2525|nr:ribosomal protein S18-alanine N-acetyltransferase [uncultured Clostridium sp.]
MNINIDLMTAEDIDGVFEISNLSLPSPWSRESYKNELNNSNARYFIAKINNKVVGFIGTWIIFDESDITNIAVHPDYRKLGIASKLINSMIDYCNKKNCTSYTLEVRAGNDAAISLYKKHGFKIEGIRKAYYQDNKEDALLMWLRLN